MRLRELGFVAALTTSSLCVPLSSAEPEKAGATFGRKVENTFRNWKLEEVPPAVQKTINGIAAGRKIEDIDREDRTGQTIWEVRFSGGENKPPAKLHIDNEGRLVRNNGEAVGSIPKLSSAPGKSQPPPPGSVGGPPAKIKRKWEDVPLAVKKAAAKYGTADHIRDIDVEKRDCMTVWELEFSREGQNVEMHFAEDGRILEHIDSAKK